ncbi:heme peroxidase [Pluteus cervinus]|uniref:Heme peroxidase n=1 Tax=Pluteus cervinus TaxID=181527 RepID=A0ACD3A715_9AGAR|nr:heme peroxidase [Pluteus cervinus]
MSYFSRFLDQTLLEVGEPATSPRHYAKAFAPPPAPPLDERAINELIEASKNEKDVDVPDRLRILRSANAALSISDPAEQKKRDVNTAAIPLVTGHLSSVDQRPLTDQAGANEKPYVRLVDQSPDHLPNPEEVFDKLLKGSDHQPNPAGVSSLLVSFSSLISLTQSFPSRESSSLNRASNALDLLPLYGLTEKDSKKIRPHPNDDSGGRGLLIPDTFFEVGDRLRFLPQTTSVLLVLLNRQHNHLARKLFELNEQGRWVDPATISEDREALQTQDDEIFKLARRLNQVTFRNMVVNDFLKGLIGIEVYDNVPSINLFANVQEAEQKENLASVEFLLQFGWNSMLSEADLANSKEALLEINGTEDVEVGELENYYNLFFEVEPDRDTRTVANLERSFKTGAFNDSELAAILFDANNSPAAAFRAKGTAQELRVFELEALKRAREWNVCGFNACRRLLGLPPYRSFEEWCGGNVAVAAAARELYGNVEELELYVGLRGEQTLDDGFKLGKTLTQGLIADIVQAVRSDPNFSQDCTPESLTAWGYNDAFGEPANGAYGGSVTKLLLRALPNEFTPQSVQALFPFLTPAEVQSQLTQLRAKNPNHPAAKFDYVFDKPEPKHVKTLNTTEAIKAVLADELTENGTISTGYGESVRDVLNNAGHLLIDDNRESHDRDEMTALLTLFPDAGSLKRYADYYRQLAEDVIQEKSQNVGDRQQVDIIQDVINTISARWAADKLCGVELNQPGGPTDRQFFQLLKDINNSMFGNHELHEKHPLLDRATKASQVVRGYIERSLSVANHEEETESWSTKYSSFFREVLFEKSPDFHPSHDYLARLAARSHDGDFKTLSSTTLGLAVLSSVSWAQTCAAAVRFYLDDKRAQERDILRGLVTEGREVNPQIMGYIREAQRLDPAVTTLHRIVHRNAVIQLQDGSTIELNQGDKVVADLKAALAEEGQNVDPTRQLSIAHGSGFHRCIGVPFVEATMPEVFKVIFSLEGLQRVKVSGKESLITSFTPPKNKTSSKPPKIVVGGKREERVRRILSNRCWDIAVVLFAAILFYWFTLVTGKVYGGLKSLIFSNPTTSTNLDSICPNTTILQPWQTHSLYEHHANQPAPFIITLTHTGNQPRKLTFIDIDKRDMQFKVFVDGKLRALSTDFRSDRRLDCGEDPEKCGELGYSTAEVLVKKGTHEVKFEWAGSGSGSSPNKGPVWGEGRVIRFMWKQEACRV